ncbi:MAG: MOSC domain-containing protein [Deltaproteobacteria bacterium]|nr:MOSC domain-containing protein [Deltaproteobacteria bacterium]
MRIGTIQSLWRYPVKSMLGEQISSTAIGQLGIPGDRGYAIRDEKAGEIRGAKNIPQLFQFSARYLATPSDTHIPLAEITLPHHTTVRTDDPTLNTQLSQALGREVTLWPRQPKDNLDHYRRAPGGLGDLRPLFGLEEGEPLPSFEGIPEEIFQYVAPLGTYFDAYPVHLLTTASLQGLSVHYPEGQFSPQRFRPNIVIATDDNRTPDLEASWKGKRLKIGPVEIAVNVPTIRCVMTTLQQGHLPKDPRILRTVVQKNAQHVGSYATIHRAGEIRVGDSVDLLS